MHFLFYYLCSAGGGVHQSLQRQPQVGVHCFALARSRVQDAPDVKFVPLYFYREAFNIIVLFWVFCGVLLLLLTQTVLQDEAAVQQAVREALTNPQHDPESADESTHGEHNPLGIHLLKSEQPGNSVVSYSTGAEATSPVVLKPSQYDSI